MPFDFTKIMYAVINFLIMVFILYKLLYKPVTNMLSTREKQILTEQEQTETENLMAIQQGKQYQEQLDQVRLEVQETIQRARKVSEENKKTIIMEAKKNAEQLIFLAQEGFQLETEKAKKELRSEAAELTILATGKLMQQAMEPEDHEKLIDDFIHEIGRSQ